MATLLTTRWDGDHLSAIADKFDRIVPVVNAYKNRFLGSHVLFTFL